MNYYTDALKKYFVFEGRTSRKQYWMFVLFNLIVSIVIAIIGGIIHMKSIGNIYSLAVLIPSIAIGVRRLHDIGRTGWWMLLCLVPIVGWIVLIIFAIQKGQPAANAYGSVPVDPTPSAPSAPSAPMTPPSQTPPAATMGQ